MNYLLTNPQNSIWLTEKFFTGSSVNNVCGYVYISDIVNFSILKQAINELVKTNDSMRLKFKEENGSCVQYLNDYKKFDIDTFELSSEKDIETKAFEMANIPFEIKDNFLFNFILFKLPNGSGGFIVNVHHIISDSWTLGLIAKEVTTIYSEILNSTYEEKAFPSYLKYIETEKEYINSDKFIKDKAYWDEIFKTVPEVASIPSLKDTGLKNVSCTGNREKFIIPENQINEIKEFCTKHKISVYNFFMTTYSLYLGRVSNLNDFVIGTPILNRTNFEQKHTMGMFISTAPLRINLEHEKSFIDFSKIVANNSMSLLRHQKYPYQAILEDLRKKDSSIPNLYNVVLSYQITKTVEENINVKYTTNWVFNGNCADDLQIHLFDLNDEASITVAYDYKTDKYDAQDIKDIHNRILTIINQVINNNEILLKDIEIVTPEEKHKILYEFNNTQVDYPKDKTIVDLFEEQVEKTPDNIAVVFENQQLTYKELNEKANQLACYLTNLNISNNDVVGLFLDKSLEVVISILATLKVGATYLPLDIDYPQSRLDYILNNSNAKVILTTNKEKEFVATIPVAYVDCNSNIYDKKYNFISKTNINTSDLAYITYTSGSTGNPKGVMIQHKNVVRLVKNTNFITFSPNDRILQTGSIVFDASTFEIFGALLNGLTVYIMRKENLLNPDMFNKYIVDNKITTLFLTTALFNKFCEFNPNMFNYLKYLLTGGEAVSNKHMKIAKLANPNLNLLHVYGPTENTTFSTYYPVRTLDNFPIGKPIANSTAYVVNKNNNLCPIGIAGELWAGGDGVAKGYLNNEDLTKEKFIQNPFGEDIIYKTGDLVKWLPDGNIEFIGRIDNQVKIRGFRIELSEIDSNILTYSNIKESISTVNTINNSKVICSYIVSDKNVNIDRLKSYLSKTLANYMIPTYIIQLDSLPLNINGKVDRKLLPLPNMKDIRKDIILPRNDQDKTILHCCEKILTTNISIDDNLFDIGLDSLSAITLSNNISKELQVGVTVKDIFNYPTIKDLSDYISTLTEKRNIKTIPKAEKQEYYPLSSAQKRIYYSSNLDNNSTLYNIAGGIIIDKLLDTKKLQKCFNNLINRHESLRAHFDIKNNEIVQIIDDKIDFKLNLESSDTNDLNKIYTDFVKPFDLSKAPLFRTKLIKLQENKMLLLLDMHHIISDGTSLGVLLQELCNLYNNEELKEKQIDYKDFTLWEKEQFESEEFKSSKEYWVNQFKDEIPLLNMPTVNPRPSVQSFEGSNYHTKLSKDVFDKVNKVAKDLNITPYMLMLACYYILLSKYTSQDDIVIGSPIVGRELPELSNMLGMFVNTLALRNKIDNSLSFEKFSNIIKNNCLNSFNNQSYPFDMLIKDLKTNRDTSRSPLFDVMFVYQNNGYPEINFTDTKTQYFIPDNNISKFDLTLEVLPINNEYDLRFEYCTKLFDEDFIKRFSSHYINILNTILDNNEIKISDIDMLSLEEKNQILYGFNNTKENYPKDKTIVDLFEEQAEKTPNNIAVVFEDKHLTYRELNEKANQLASHLTEYGITNNSIVGIMVPRSLEMIITMFGILKTGAAYLPLDPSYPKNRIKYILKDSNVSLLLTKANSVSLDNVETIDISIDKSNIYKKCSNTNLNRNFASSNLAYVIYTSGSTGNPKGVSITHKNVNNFIKGITSKIKFDSVIVSVTTICFDIFVLESILPLQKGLTVIIANESEQTVPQLLNELCIKNNVTMLQTTPSKFSLLTSDEDSLEFLKNIKTLMLGGEPFPSNLLTKIKNLSTCKIYNMYGPTETTVWSSIKDLTDSDDITIGSPIANTSMYVLDNNLNMLPIGIPGTLYIGGEGLSKGYLNKEDLTNKKFIYNPYNDSEKIYNTGDLAKWSQTGELICLGRSDFQVKIRGLRIELEEIEKTILIFNNIENAVVTVNTDSLNRQVLCAYFISKNRISISELKQYLSMFLPNYMLPTYITQIEDFKYTPNGKIDKKSLPVPDFTTERKHIILPKTDTEFKILKIWEELLCISPISISDNFFEIGGDSLLALKMQIELLKQNISVTYAEIFKYNTVKKLALLVDKKTSNSDSNIDIYNNYDYSNVNSVLCNNNITNLTDIEYHSIGNVLLTGVTGFLGAHILDYLMKNTDVNVYCLVRKDPSTSLTNKVLNKLHFYFGNIYDELINKRIFIINSDLTQNQLGLSDEKIISLKDKISCVINSAALVKHYGTYDEFESVNVTSVKKLIDFCKKYNKKLVQISTISVSGNTLTDLAINTNDFTSDVEFNESNLYINQSMENVYVRSKFEAEKLILEEFSKNKLDALILRIGNITNRITDGKFQSNSNENAFANRIKAFIEISSLPDYILDKYIEFSPVDAVAEAVIKSIEYANKKISVLHIYNQNHVYLNDFIQLLPKKYNLNIVSDLEFKNIINDMLKNNDKKYIISHILNDLNAENKLIYETYIKIKNDFSQSFFNKIGFKWPNIDKKYIENLLNNI